MRKYIFAVWLTAVAAASGATSAPKGNDSTASSVATTTELSASQTTSYPGSLVVLTATISPSAATGTVTFYNGTASLGTVSLSGGEATLSTHFSSTGGYNVQAAYSGDSTYASSSSDTLPETVAAGSYSLDLSTYSSTTGITTVQTDNSYDVTYTLYQNVVYAANPVDKTYESMNILIPTSINGTTISGQQPILLDINVAGYTSSSVWGQNSVGSTNAQYALGKGYVVVEVGCRGRDNQSGSTYYGKAPSAIVDLKAAVRFLRYNYSAGNFSGDVGHIIDSGGSAGGALASLLGASGNSIIYYPYLAAIGAADADDSIFAVGAWSPITNLDHADMAYEWEYSGLPYSASAGGPPGGGPPGGPPPPGANFRTGTAASFLKSVRPSDNTTTTVNSSVSSHLQTLFQNYQNGLALTDERSNYGTLTYSNLDDYILTQFMEPSAALYLSSLSSSDLSSYLSSNTWITWDSTNLKATFTFADYVNHIGTRGKSVPAFDAFFDLTTSDSTVNTTATAEVSEFGNSTTDARHFTNFSSQYVDGTTISNDMQAIVNMMNPMYFILNAGSSGDTSGLAKYWYIRDGSIATDTSAMIIVDLITTVENVLGTGYVNGAEDWDTGHAVNKDPAGFSAWVTASVAATQEHELRKAPTKPRN